MYSGGTMFVQHVRTVDMLQDMIDQKKPLTDILWFLYDCQTTYDDLKQLAQIAKDVK
jgi:hypothetical protein